VHSQNQLVSNDPSSDGSNSCVIQSEIDGTVWDEFLGQRQDASFFHLFGWKALHEEHFGHKCFFLSARDNHEILAVLPITFLENPVFGRKMCSMPFVDFGGPCGDDPLHKRLLLEYGAQLVADLSASHLEVRSIVQPSQDWPSQTHKVMLTLDIDEGHENIWSSFKGKHRTNIRRAYKNGLTVKMGRYNLLDEFYSLLSASWHNLGSPIYSRDFFKHLLDIFDNHVSIFVTYDSGGKPVAAALNGYFDGKVEGLWAGMLPSARALQPNYVLYWEMIKDACERNCTVFRMGRSTAGSPAESFKKKWGAHANSLYWSYYLSGGREMPKTNTEKKHLQIGASIWRRLPHRIVRALGPSIARNIP
jgi:FemAB-related protein (PEP-CTERM system-associated)